MSKGVQPVPKYNSSPLSISESTHQFDRTGTKQNEAGCSTCPYVQKFTIKHLRVNSSV